VVSCPDLTFLGASASMHFERQIKCGYSAAGTQFLTGRMIAGGRSFNYCENATNIMSRFEYAQKVIKGELRDPVLSFELDNGFYFVKILPNYLDDIHSLNYASFIEWLNVGHDEFYARP
jgi:hypothetical protein